MKILINLEKFKFEDPQNSMKKQKKRSQKNVKISLFKVFLTNYGSWNMAKKASD